MEFIHRSFSKKIVYTILLLKNNVKVWERSGNFADVVKPDAINVIDFLEIHKDFWEVGGMLKDIHGKLRKGIAVVALQKSKEKESGTRWRYGLRETPAIFGYRFRNNNNSQMQELARRAKSQRPE